MNMNDLLKVARRYISSGDIREEDIYNDEFFSDKNKIYSALRSAYRSYFDCPYDKIKGNHIHYKWLKPFVSMILGGRMTMTHFIELILPAIEKVQDLFNEIRDPELDLEDGFQLDPRENYVWCINSLDIIKLWKVTTVKSFNLVLDETLHAIKSMQRSIPRYKRYRKGIHFGEMFRIFMPRSRRSAKKIFEYLKGVHRVESLRHVTNYYMFYDVVIHAKHMLSIGTMSKEEWDRMCAFSKNAYENPSSWPEAKKLLETKTLLWKKSFGRIPFNEKVFALPNRVIEVLKKNFKHFLSLIKGVEEPHDIIGAAYLSIAFGGKAIDMLRYSDLNTFSSLGILTKPQADFLYKNRKFSQLGIVINIIHAWDQVVAELGNNFSLQEALNVRASWIYSGMKPEYKALGEELLKYNYNQSAFKKACEIWDKPKTASSIPAVFAEENGYRMYRLDDDDPRHLTIGQHTNCCQHLTGAGQSCAIHSYQNMNGTTYVVEKHGRVVAQSWTWRNGQTIVFDNIELLSKDYKDTIVKLYQKVADQLIGKLGITSVYVGAGYDKLGVSEYWEKTNPVLTPQECYTDAHTQYSISRKESL